MFIIQQCNKSYLLDCKLSLTFSSCRFSEGSARARCEVIFFSLKFRSKFFETVLSWGKGLGQITLPPPLVRARFARVAQSCSRQNRHATQARSMPGGHGNRSNWTMHNTHRSYYSDRIIANAIVSWDENFYINSLWKGTYSANLVFIWYNQIYRKEGTINLKLISNSGYEEHCGISTCPAHQNWSSRSVPRNWEIPRLWQSIGICNSWFKQLYISRHSLDLTINLEKA